MLNSVLASLAVMTWGASYVIYFQRDVRRWWKHRHRRRALADFERQRARAAYAAWASNIPPPRSRVAILPDPLPDPPAAPARSAVILPFPRERRPARG